MLARPKNQLLGSALAFRGTAFAEIWPQLLLIFVISVVITFEYEAWGLDVFSLTTIPFSLVGLALSIFLGFRNNACYDRWWEARKLWGALINTTRTLARQILILSGPKEGGKDEALQAFQEENVRRVIAYTYALKFHLRTEAKLDAVAAFIPDDELEELRSHKNVPIAVLQTMGEEFRVAWRRGWLDTFQMVTLEQCLKDLTNIQGGCERIKNTPVPLSYTILTHRIVAIYCFALPFGIVAEIGALTPLVVLLISYAFLGLDNVGSQLEDPFEVDANDLPLAAMARLIEVNLLQSLDTPVETLPPFKEPVDGIIL